MMRILVALVLVVFAVSAICFSIYVGRKQREAILGYLRRRGMATPTEIGVQVRLPVFIVQLRLAELRDRGLVHSKSACESDGFNCREFWAA